MIAAPGVPGAGADVHGTTLWVGDAEPAPLLARLLARLLAGEPLDRDERGAIVGEVLRLWALEAPAADAATSAGGYSSPRSFAVNRSK